MPSDDNSELNKPNTDDHGNSDLFSDHNEVEFDDLDDFELDSVDDGLQFDDFNPDETDDNLSDPFSEHKVEFDDSVSVAPSNEADKATASPFARLKDASAFAAFELDNFDDFDDFDDSKPDKADTNRSATPSDEASKSRVPVLPRLHKNASAFDDFELDDLDDDIHFDDSKSDKAGSNRSSTPSNEASKSRVPVLPRLNKKDSVFDDFDFTDFDDTDDLEFGSLDDDLSFDDSSPTTKKRISPSNLARAFLVIAFYSLTTIIISAIAIFASQPITLGSFALLVAVQSFGAFVFSILFNNRMVLVLYFGLTWVIYFVVGVQYAAIETTLAPMVSLLAIFALFIAYDRINNSRLNRFVINFTSQFTVRKKPLRKRSSASKDINFEDDFFGNDSSEPKSSTILDDSAKGKNEEPKIIPARPRSLYSATSKGSYFDLKDRVERKLRSELELLELKDMDKSRETTEELFSWILAEDSVLLSRMERSRLFEAIFSEIFGYGPLDALLKDETVTEIYINGAKNIFVKRKGYVGRANIVFEDENHLAKIIDKFLIPSGQKLDDENPIAHVSLTMKTTNTFKRSVSISDKKTSDE